MSVLDTLALRQTLSFKVSDEDLASFDPDSGSMPAMAGVVCNNAGCKNL